MKLWRITRMLGILLAGLIGYLAQDGPRALAADPNDANGVEVLTRGPVHEAFAEPNSDDPAPGVVVPKEAPGNIEEIPPDEKPEGDALWIPGYWQWDDDRSDFIWISGIWRVPPAGCEWVPGYWTGVTDGWSWTPGYWMTNQAEEVTYLPQPPASLEVGPSSPAPSDDYLWSTGNWYYNDARYVWRPGHWVQSRPDRVWSPSYYVYTPRGAIYVDGYWDWSLDRRGVLFAPVYISSSIWRRPNYFYSPSIVIQSDLLMAHLFVGATFGHYYFGDYYDEGYSRRGIYPWFEVRKSHHDYDPIYSYERMSRRRTDAHWEANVRENYDYRRQHSEARPPRLYSAQAAFVARAPERERKSMGLAAPLSVVSQRRDAPLRFEKISEDRRKTFKDQGNKLTQESKVRRERAPVQPNRALKGRVQDQPRQVQKGRVQDQTNQIQKERVKDQPKQLKKGRVQDRTNQMQKERVKDQPRPVQKGRVQDQTNQIQKERVKDQPRPVQKGARPGSDESNTEGTRQGPAQASAEGARPGSDESNAEGTR